MIYRNRLRRKRIDKVHDTTFRRMFCILFRKPTYPAGLSRGADVKMIENFSERMKTLLISQKLQLPIFGLNLINAIVVSLMFIEEVHAAP